MAFIAREEKENFYNEYPEGSRVLILERQEWLPAKVIDRYLQSGTVKIRCEIKDGSERTVLYGRRGHIRPVKTIELTDDIVEKNWSSAEAYLEARADEMEREIDQAQEAGLAEWQLKNCVGCFFADPHQVGTGMPCCTRIGGPIVQGDKCASWKRLKQDN